MAQYIYGGNTGETPQSVARKRAIAEAIMGRSLSPQNVGEGFGAIADGIVANVTNQRADAAEQAGTASAQDAFTKALMGDPSALASIGSGGANGGFGGGGNYADAIAGIESGGNYGAVGPTDPSLGRALGKYQVMEANIGPWSKEILGREVSPDEFLANPQLQDAIFNGKFNQYVQQFGPEGAAQAWFAGPGSIGAPGAGNRTDSLGTSVSSYVDKFRNNLTGGINGQQPFAGGGSLAPEQGAPMPAPQAPQQPARSGPDLNELLMLSANPWLTEGQRNAINTMIETQLKQRDPAYQLGLEKSQLEIDALRNPTPKPVYEGGQWWDTSGGVPHALTQPEPGFRQLSAEEAQQRGLDPEKSWQVAPTGEIKQIGGGGVNVSVNGERGFDKTVGEGYGKRFLDIQDAAQSAQRTLDGLDVMEQAMSDPNFYSGSGADYINGLKRLGASIGINPDSVSSAETFNAMAKQAALDSMGGSLGTGFSNADRDFVTDQVPSLSNTPEGNRKLIAIQRKLNLRKQQIAQQARLYASQHDGRIDSGFDDALAQWAEANPLFPKKGEQGPPIGTIEDGYRFKGGDPADQSNWEPVQ
ncbi:MAG TPA: hypothetical protein VFL97_04290 [Nitrococcus sp.]|nr:hypothetical protein [Nitrococcus sp.]